MGILSLFLCISQKRISFDDLPCEREVAVSVSCSVVKSEQVEDEEVGEGERLLGRHPVFTQSLRKQWLWEECARNYGETNKIDVVSQGLKHKLFFFLHCLPTFHVFCYLKLFYVMKNLRIPLIA